ncbi:cytochrome b-c1 complex subunit 10 [Coccinella septempunctata]|uniref:cytochrome b-c1 complex subunit 10 n=1 Tax=Coccinella septempunctata TaxID=41139 RepID=UPI001D07A28D|nr:cytochrome b-c1 complex subunit 10 [Coccinella septempunctata]
MSSKECDCTDDVEKPQETEKPPKKPSKLLKFPKVGEKQKEILYHYKGSAFKFGTAACILIIYATDWKAVLQYVPYINEPYKTK